VRKFYDENSSAIIFTRFNFNKKCIEVSLPTKNIASIPWVIVTCDIPFGDKIYAVDTILANIQDLGCHLGPHPASVYLQHDNYSLGLL
jgi:hypothetical protein